MFFSGIPNGKSLSDKSVVAYDFANRRRLFEISLSIPVTGLAILPKLVAVASPGEVRLYNIESATLHSQHRCYFEQCMPMDFIDQYGTSILAMQGTNAGELKLIFIDSSGQDIKVLQAHNHALSQIKFSSDGIYVATSSLQGTLIRLFHVQTASVLREYRRGSFQSAVHSLAFSPQNDFIALTSSKGTLHLFSISTGEQAKPTRSTITWNIPESNFSVVTFAASGILALIRSDGYLNLLKINLETNSIEPYSSRCLIMTE